jgi:hypothetical protein
MNLSVPYHHTASLSVHSETVQSQDEINDSCINLTVCLTAYREMKLQARSHGLLKTTTTGSVLSHYRKLQQITVRITDCKQSELKSTNF